MNDIPLPGSKCYIVTTAEDSMLGLNVASVLYGEVVGYRLVPGNSLSVIVKSASDGSLTIVAAHEVTTDLEKAMAAAQSGDVT
jgi:hypothetical protein